MIIVATMEICTNSAPLMWVIFGVKCVKLFIFYILEGLMQLLLRFMSKLKWFVLKAVFVLGENGFRKSFSVK